jgi:hypothetical protein
MPGQCLAVFEIGVNSAKTASTVEEILSRNLILQVVIRRIQRHLDLVGPRNQTRTGLRYLTLSGNVFGPGVITITNEALGKTLSNRLVPAY